MVLAIFDGADDAVDCEYEKKVMTKAVATTTAKPCSTRSSDQDKAIAAAPPRPPTTQVITTMMTRTAKT